MEGHLRSQRCMKRCAEQSAEQIAERSAVSVLEVPRIQYVVEVEMADKLPAASSGQSRDVTETVHVASVKSDVVETGRKSVGKGVEKSVRKRTKRSAEESFAQQEPRIQYATEVADALPAPSMAQNRDVQPLRDEERIHDFSGTYNDDVKIELDGVFIDSAGYFAKVRVSGPHSWCPVVGEVRSNRITVSAFGQSGWLVSNVILWENGARWFRVARLPLPPLVVASSRVATIAPAPAATPELQPDNVPHSNHLAEIFGTAVVKKTQPYVVMGTSKLAEEGLGPSPPWQGESIAELGVGPSQQGGEIISRSADSLELDSTVVTSEKRARLSLSSSFV